MASAQPTSSAKIVVLGGGPAGLYAALLLKKANPALDVSAIERNAAGVTYGWGVVFSDRTLASFQQADDKTFSQISSNFVIWDAIDVHYRGETIRCGGHVIAAISRKVLLDILQRRCLELGVSLTYERDVAAVEELPPCDLLVAADGVNSLVRRTYEPEFRPKIEPGRARYIWLGAEKVLDAFNFIFRETEHGLFQVHAYPFSGTTSTFIVECEEAVWQRAGLESATEVESLEFCQRLLKEDLNGACLLANTSKWISFPTLKTARWSLLGREGNHPRIVLLGDAAHTAHFSIGSGTKLAMEDAIALANAVEARGDLDAAVQEYELERRPIVETFQRAAQESQVYFETLKRYLVLEPVQFAFQLLTRSGRITYDDLRGRDTRFGDMVDRWFQEHASCRRSEPDREAGERCEAVLAAPPLFAPIRLRELALPNRLAVRIDSPGEALPRGAGLVLTGMIAVSSGGRVSPDTPVLSAEEDAEPWRNLAERAHSSGASLALVLGHAGRRGATRPRAEGLDRPLKSGAWPLVSASPLPYTPLGQVPAVLDSAGMDRVRDSFVQAAQLAAGAGADVLVLHFANGHLLASFLSPLTNLREDEYGGDSQSRMRFPLEVFGAVREVWPSDHPLAVALNASDCARGGFEVGDAVAFAAALKEAGCDLVEVLAGQTLPDAEPAYGRGFLTSYSDRIRNEAQIPTLVGGYLTSSNDVNTVLAAGKADICVISRRPEQKARQEEPRP